MKAHATKPFDIVAMGEGMVEFNQVGLSGSEFRQGFGGDTSNAVIAASRQGARTAYLTRVGSDLFGRKLLDLWRAENVNIDAVEIDSDAPTGVYFVSHDASGHAFDYLRKGSAASRMTEQNMRFDQVADARWFHVSGISQAMSANACDTVFAAIDIARNAGTKVSFDPNLRLKMWPLPRAKAIIEATIPLTDLFLPSLDEAMLLAGSEEVIEIFNWCFARGARAVVLKSGAEGAWHAVKGASPALVSGTRVTPVDATGAGDCFDGSLLARLAAGDALADAVAYANVSAALSTLGHGAVAPIPHADAVLEKLRF